MVFQGDLSNINLASVFQNLLHNRQTGTLVLRSGREERYIYFRDGSVTMYSRGKGAPTPVETLLVRHNVLDETGLNAAKKKRRGRASLTQVVSKMELAPPERIKEAVAAFVLDELCDLFTWEGGTFEFIQGEPVEGAFDREIALAGISLDTNEVILEAARRVDEWERINRCLGSSKDIYVLRKEREGELETSDNPDVKRVVALLDGYRSVERVAEDSGLGRFLAMKILADLVQARMLRQLSVSELRAGAVKAVEENRLEQARDLLERAIEMEHGNAEAHLLLARVKEKSGRHEEAATSFKVAAGLFLEDGEPAKAAEALRDAIRNQPHDLAARERLYHLLKDTKRRDEAKVVLLDAASYCMRMGLSERARALLEDGLSFVPEDEDILRLLADVYVESGQGDKAADLFRRRAEQALERSDYPTALRWYEEVLKIRPGDENARRRIVEITSGAMERRRRRNKLVFRSVLAGLVLAVVFYFGLLEFSARKSEKVMMNSLITAVLSGDPAAPRKILLDFAAKHPYTRPSDEAMRLLRLVDAFQALKLFEQAEALQAAGKNAEAAALYKRLKMMDLPSGFIRNVDARLSALPAVE